MGEGRRGVKHAFGKIDARLSTVVTMGFSDVQFSTVEHPFLLELIQFSILLLSSLSKF